MSARHAFDEQPALSRFNNGSSIRGSVDLDYRFGAGLSVDDMELPSVHRTTFNAASERT